MRKTLTKTAVDFRPKRLPALGLCLVFGLSGCVQSSPGTLNFAGGARADVQLSPAQNCAIGYDLSKQVYDRVVLSEAVIVPGRRPTACEAYTLEYLRRAGFAIDETANRAPLEVMLSRSEEGHILAVATIGGTMRLTRPYQAAPEGVYPKGAVSFQALPEGARLKPLRKKPAQRDHESGR